MDIFSLRDNIGIMLGYLLSPVYYIFREGETAHTWSAHYAMMTRRGMRHLHRRELEKAFTESYPTKQKLSRGIMFRRYRHIRSLSLTCDKCNTTCPCAEDIRCHRQCHKHIGCSRKGTSLSFHNHI